MPGPMPKHSLAPEGNATYSGLLECPITSRLRKHITSGGWNDSFAASVPAPTRPRKSRSTCSSLLVLGWAARFPQQTARFVSCDMSRVLHAVTPRKIGPLRFRPGPWPYGVMTGEISDYGDWEGRGGSKGTTFLCQDGVEYKGKFIGACPRGFTADKCVADCKAAIEAKRLQGGKSANASLVRWGSCRCEKRHSFEAHCSAQISKVEARLLGHVVTPSLHMVMPTR